MLDCGEIKEYMSLYIDDELDKDKKEQFEEHIKNCDICKKELEELKNIISDLENLPQEELPDDFHKDLMLLVNYENKRKPKILWKQYSMMAASIIVLFIVFNIFTNGNQNINYFQNQYINDIEQNNENENIDLYNNDNQEIQYDYNENDLNKEDIQSEDTFSKDSNVLASKAKGIDDIYANEEKNITPRRADVSHESYSYPVNNLYDKIQIIKFNIQIETEDFDTIVNNISNILTDIEKKEIQTDNNSIKTANIYSKIPISNFDIIVNEIREISGIKNDNIISEYKTEEYNQIKAERDKKLLLIENHTGLSNEIENLTNEIENLNNIIYDMEHSADYPEVIINIIEKQKNT